MTVPTGCRPVHPKQLAYQGTKRYQRRVIRVAVLMERGSLQWAERAHVYGARHLIENFFAKIKQFRAIATRYDKTARNFLAAVLLVASVIWLN